MNFLQLLKRLTGVSVVTSVITLAASLWLAKIMIAEDFGMFSYYQSLLMIFVNIIPFGSGLAVVIYLFSASGKKYSKIISNSLFFLMPLSTVCSFLGLTLFSCTMDNPLDWQIISLLILNALFMSICLTGIHFIRTKQAMKRYSIYFGLYTLAVSLGGIIGYSLFESIKLLYLTTLSALVILSIFTLYFLHKECHLSLSYPNKSKTFFRSVKYGLPVVLNSTVMSFMVIGDKIILGGMVELNVLARYSIAALIASTTLFLVNNFATAWGGYLSKEITLLDKCEIIEIYYKHKYKLLLVLPIGFSIYLIQIFIYKLFYEQNYPGLEEVIFVLTFGYCCLGVSKYFVGYLSCLGENYLVFYISIVSCLAMIITSTLIFKGTLLDMGIAVSFSFFIQIILFNSITNKVLTTNANG
jgi:O-antigen/teichoic acid export membrane protein